MPRKKTEEPSTEAVEQVVNIPLANFRYFENHPFKVTDDEAMLETAESVKEYGVLMPTLARPHPNGGYELISGHRRHRASEIAGLETLPVIIRDLDDNAATIIMVDSNLQRESVLPSERAFAYKMKLDAVKRIAGRPLKENVCQVGTNLRSDEIIAENTEHSARQVQRFISLTKLVPELLQMVDNKEIGFTPAVELSSLTKEEQKMLLDVLDSEQAIPSLSQAQRIKALSKDGNCNFDTMSRIMCEEKKSVLEKISFSTNKLKKYFPKSYTPKKMEETIIKLLEIYLKKRTQQQER